MSTRGLTWSRKWHIINEGHPEAGRYAVALCGAYVYRDDDPRYPSQLKRVKDGTLKSTGLCKLCARSTGVQSAEVVLARVTQLAEKWENATELTTSNQSIVARAFAAELRDALEAGAS